MTDLLLRGARRVYPLIILAAGTLAAGIARADDDDPRPAAGIKEHSFLIEEAYNQEAGEIQHVVTLQRQQRDWFFHFSQEWALGSQTHQLGYSVPYSWLRGDGQRVKGIGDVEITYRYQAWLESATMPAFAPTLSVVLPTGSRSKALGDGSFGVEIKLPFSKIVSDRVTLHANAGMTHHVRRPGAQPHAASSSAAAPIYAVTRDFNLMLESLVEWTRVGRTMPATLERETTFTLNPGFRNGV